MSRYAYNYAGQKHHQLVEHDNRPEAEYDERRRQFAHDNVIIATHSSSWIFIRYCAGGRTKRRTDANDDGARPNYDRQLMHWLSRDPCPDIGDHAWHFSPSTVPPPPRTIFLLLLLSSSSSSSSLLCTLGIIDVYSEVGRYLV